MSLSSDNFTALVHLRDQARKWKNIAFIIAIIATALISEMFFSSKDEEISAVDGGKDYIANINIEGIILNDEYRDKILNKIAEQENIKAVIVNINSPGGGIVGSEILYENLQKISKNKPIVVVMGALAASGGYMASIASDYIIAHNGTLTGSVGVIIQASEVTELANKLGVNFLVYKSAKLKGVPSPFEKTDPQIDRVINESIQDSNEFFINLVLERRKDKINQKEISIIKDGRFFTGRQALEVGLIDEIGGKDQAINYLSKIHKIDIKNLKVKDVPIEKTDNGLVRFFGKDTVSKILGLSTEQKGLMAVFR